MTGGVEHCRGARSAPPSLLRLGVATCPDSNATRRPPAARESCRARREAALYSSPCALPSRCAVARLFGGLGPARVVQMRRSTSGFSGALDDRRGGLGVYYVPPSKDKKSG